MTAMFLCSESTNRASPIKYGRFWILQTMFDVAVGITEYTESYFKRKVETLSTIPGRFFPTTRSIQNNSFYVHVIGVRIWT